MPLPQSSTLPKSLHSRTTTKTFRMVPDLPGRHARNQYRRRRIRQTPRTRRRVTTTRPRPLAAATGINLDLLSMRTQAQLTPLKV